MSSMAKSHLREAQAIIGEDPGFVPVNSFEWAPWTWIMEFEVLDPSSDASGDWGLGAEWAGRTLAREWDQSERDLPIYLKEIVAVLEAIKRWGKEWKG